MTDLIERLRKPIEGMRETIDTAPHINALKVEAADEIEALRIQLKQAEERAEYAWKNTNTIEKERQRLEAALEAVCKIECVDDLWKAQEIVRGLK